MPDLSPSTLRRVTDTHWRSLNDRWLIDRVDDGWIATDTVGRKSFFTPDDIETVQRRIRLGGR